MAEHILGILLVTQSSRERNVFRYPPDPTSPSDRLSQPIYPRATYTAQDTTVDNAGHRRMFKKYQDSNRGSRGFSQGQSSGAASHLRGSDRPGASGFSGFSGGRSRRGASESGTADESTSIFGPSAGGSIHSRATEGGSGEDSDSSSDESEFDGLWEGPGQQQGGAGTRRFSSGTDSSGRAPGAGLSNSGPRPLTEIQPHSSERRGSLGSEDTTRPKKHSPSIESQYNSSMGYSLDFLSDLLSPPRKACNRKFEISVDELVFIGHPVCCNSEGKWAYPADDSDDEGRDARRVSRGRKMESGVRDLSLGAVAEHPESPQPVRFQPNWSALSGSSTEVSSGLASGTETPVSGSNNNTRPNTSMRKEEKTDEPHLSMFHLVLILDKPDPRPDEDEEDILDEVYREIAFKWTAAAFALQVRENWVAKEVRDLHKIREKAIQENIPVHECLQKCIEKTQIAESLHQLFSALHKIKGRPVNNHFATLSTTVRVNVGSIPVTIIVPPKTSDADGNAADLDSSDSDSDDEWGLVSGPDGTMLAKQPNCPVEPWKTLLILDEELPRPRLADRRASQVKIDEEALVDQLINASDISKPLSEIAHLLRCDFEGVIIPLARDLIQNKRAILVDVVNIRLRSILLPTKVSDHLRSITQHSVRFSVEFPKLPPLVTFVAMISQRLVPFRDLLPPEAQADPAKRDPWVRAVAWLLRNDLVTQAHVRARVVASGAIKEAAWRRLWHRRRRRWLRERRDSQASQASVSTNRSRPSFGESAAGMVASPNSDRADGNTLGSGWPQLAARVPRTPLAVTRTLSMGETLADPDSDFEMDSDVEGDDVAEVIRPPPGLDSTEGEYELDVDEPNNVPSFSASFIFHPSRAQKDEARWLRVIRERTSDAVMRSRFDMCVQYFDGITTFEEIVFRTGLSRRELDRISHIFRDDLLVTIHP